MKPCKCCGFVKPLTDFYANKLMKDGRLNVCIPCDLSRKKKAHSAKRDERLATMKAYREANKEKVAAIKKEWADRVGYGKTPKRLEYAKEWRKRNSEHVRERERKRYASDPYYKALNAEKASRRRACIPFWADKDKIRGIYMDARKMTKETGVVHHVDHVIPIKHRLVCGLHVPENLSVITAVDNLQKKNKFIV